MKTKAATRVAVGLLVLTLFSGRAWALAYDANVTPDVIFGSGNANGLFTVDQNNGVELGLRAKIPFAGVVHSNGDGTYSYSLAELLSADPSQKWNFDWTVNTDWDGSSGLKIDDLTYLLQIDFDPSLGTDFLEFDPITPTVAAPFQDHSIGTNATPNGGGTEATDAASYAALIASNNVCQQSWRHGFFTHPTRTYDATIDGTYDIVLSAFDGGGLVASTSIRVIIGAGGAPVTVFVNDDWTSQTDVDSYDPSLVWQFDAFDNIQDGIDAVAHSTVNVLPGTYGPFVLNSTVNVLGAQAGVDARGRVIGVPNPAVESIVTAGSGILCELLNGSGGSVIDGFAFVGATNAIRSNGGPLDDLEILNNHIEGTSSAAVFLNDSGDDITVHQNSIDGSSAGGGGLFHLDQDTFDGFHFTSNWILNGDTGFFVDGTRNVGVSGARSPLFEDNLFDGNGAGANFGRFGVEYATVRNNTFSNNLFDGLQGGIQNSLITQNTFNGNDRAGLRLTGFGGTGDATRGALGNMISNNFFSGNGAGASASGYGDIRVDDQFDGTQATNVISDNRMTSTVAVFNNETSGETLDFSGNRWGTSTNPETALKMLGAGAADIDYTPWLDIGTDTDGGTPGFQGDFSVLNVDDDSPQSGSESRIMEALALLTNSTINILPGTYLEPYPNVIGKDVDFIGDPLSKPILTNDTDTGTSGDARAWWLVESGWDVSFQNLIFDGSGAKVYTAIRSHGTLDVTNCDFTEIKYDASGPSYAGVGVQQFDSSGAPLTVSDCTFTQMGRIGIFTLEPTVVERCTYTGKGVGDFLDYFMCVDSLGASVGNATITDCTVTNNRGVASSDGSTSGGILVTTYYGAGTSAALTNNVLTDNTVGLAVGYDAADAASVMANFNQIYGNDYGVVNTSSINTVDALDNWWGDASGPADPAGTFEADNPPCYASDFNTSLDVINADGTGDSVSDLNVDYCSWLLAPATLTLNPDAACITTVGDVLTVTIDATDLTTNVVGGQFFLSYDNSVLDFVSAVSGNPLFTELFESVDEGAGTIDYAVNAPSGDPGTSADVTMVVLTFNTLVETCDASALVAFRPHAPPTRLSDYGGGDVLPDLLDLSSITIDETDPVVSGLSVIGGDVDGSCERTVTFSATVTDNCCVLAGDVTVGVVLTTGNATLGVPNITKTQTDAQTVTITGDVLVSALTSCPATVEVTVDASDCCGNAAVSDSDTGDVNDATDPVITCPADITVSADAGLCTAAIDPGLATATDNCDPAPAITWSRSDGASSLLDPYDEADSPITITWTATDACNNSSSCDQVITVNAVNEVLVDLVLQNVSEPTLDRCITFELWDCAGPTQTTVEEVLTFTSGVASTTIEVPCGVYTCITARDKLHTLRRTIDPLPTSGTQYVADFAGASKDLIGGNLNDDFYVDILDFGTFSFQYGTTYANGDTTCATAAPHSDISGDGTVGSGDFTFIQINFLSESEANCCGMAGRPGEGADGPVREISVQQLRQMGMGELQAGDLNHDGWLDSDDVVEFLNGARPRVIRTQISGTAQRRP